MPASPDRRSACPVVFALDLFGDRWTLLIVRDMVLRGWSSYGEFLSAGEGISTNILADRLRRLEADGIVTKHDDPEHGAKFRYKLTKKGIELIPVLVQMILWSARHDAETPVSTAMRRRLDRDPEAIVAELKRRAKRGQPGFDAMRTDRG